MTKILIVEDEMPDRYMLETLLKGFDFDVISAENGIEALTIARKELPDIIISDIMMPVMDGFVLCRECKNDVKLKIIPFIFYTATYTSSKDEEFAYSIGADRFLTKPQVIEDFHAILLEVMEEYYAGKLALEPPLGMEMEFFRKYNEVLFEKLEKKVSQLSKEVTARKLATKELNHSLEMLRRSNEELTHFAYIASHDLQEPLRTITSFLQLLEKKYKGKIDSEADEFIKFAVDGAKRLQEMIVGLLSYSRIETKGNQLEKNNFSEILEKVILNIKVAIEESGAVITHDSLPEIDADESQMIQVFQNLISNSIKFNKSKPEIHISAKLISELKGSKIPGAWLFSVKDNGIGIASKYSDKLFTYPLKISW